MKQGSIPIKSGFARSVIYLIALAALAVCAILLPELIREESVGKPTSPLLTYSFLAGAYIIATPFFIALYQTHKLLNYIDKNKAFTSQSIKALQNVKTCATIFSALIIIALIATIILTQSKNPREDITPFATIGFILIFISTIITTFVAVLQKLLTQAITLKSQNDLII